MKIRTLGYLMLIAAIMISASTPIAYVLGNNISAIQLMFFVSLVGTLVSFVAMTATGSQKHLVGIVNNRTQLTSLVAASLLMFVILTYTFAFATHYITASLAAVVYRTWPLMLIALAPFMLREKIGRWDVLAVLVGFSTLAFVLVGGTSISLPLLAIPFVFIMLIAAFSDALASAIQKRYNYELYSSMFVYNLTALFAFGIFGAAFGGLSISGITMTDIYVILFLGIFQNVGLTIAYVSTLRTLKTSLVGSVMNISPFVTMGLGVVLLAEPIEPAYILIAVGVLAGLAIQKLAPKSGNYLNKSKNKRSLPTVYDVTSAFVNTKNSMIYDVMKGSGRVLAFYKGSDGVRTEEYKDYIENENLKRDGCIILTNKTNSEAVGADELEFIKEIMGHGENDLVVLGAGNPEVVEGKLADINGYLEK